ncbi:hypothetical protein AK812_SmicGene4280 [Symbiodinium microadriaticum]|uniref:Uncharacterized protein n=1 Tax=Symbiodinium microadriaticum TaxID=2951 RepID=A0A1Q9EWP3_SYMMI|nr:hypothetical protein AK812_SmicGene4280 [Symbiodinium microadriaticum]
MGLPTACPLATVLTPTSGILLYADKEHSFTLGDLNGGIPWQEALQEFLAHQPSLLKVWPLITAVVQEAMKALRGLEEKDFEDSEHNRRSQTESRSSHDDDHDHDDADDDGHLPDDAADDDADNDADDGDGHEDKDPLKEPKVPIHRRSTRSWIDALPNSGAAAFPTRWVRNVSIFDLSLRRRHHGDPHMMQGNAGAYPQLPSAAFPKRGSPSNPVLYDTHGAFSFSSYGPGYGAYSRLPLPPATASPAPA